MPRRYPAGGTYRGQYNSFQEPTIGQYESFFNPIPIEFLQEELGKRQGKYDTAFAGTIAAKEAMAQQQAALQDLGSKNQIIGDTMGNIDKVVEEKYGGDWGRASKEIAGLVSSARQNPFWETTKHLSEQQKLQQKYQLDNPDAHIYQDVLGQSTIDPETGKVRDRGALTFRGGKRGDWQGSVAEQFKDVRADVVDAELDRARDVEGMLSKERVEEITNTTLKTMAEQGVDTFLENNPDFYKSKKEIEGLTDEQIRVEAEDYIMGRIQTKEYKSTTTQVMQDRAYFENLKARAAGISSSGIITANSGEFVEVSIDDPNQAARQRRQAKAEIDNMPEGDKKDALVEQYERDGKAREFVIHNTQNSEFAVDIPSYYDEYAKWAEKNNQDVSSLEEFEERVFDAVRDGTIPDRDKAFSPTYGGGYNLDNAARMAGRKMNQAMRRFRDDDGTVAMNVNVIGGELGTKDQDTYVGRFNKLVTDEWNSSMTGFTVPYSNRQIGDILENDKRYNGKKRNTLPRDSKRDKVRMTDGFMNGKPVYQVTFYDKTGEELGSEYISPNNVESTTGNMQNAAIEMINSNDPQKQQIGQTILVNSVYSPAIQNADIHNNAEGTFKGVQHDGNEVKFEKTPQGTYHLYTMVDGKKDYFRKQDSQGNITNFEPTNEAEIKDVLIAAQGL